MKRPLTPAQRRVMQVLWRGDLIRRRGAFGEYQSDPNDRRFAGVRTIETLVRDGLIQPGPYWGTYVAVRR